MVLNYPKLVSSTTKPTTDTHTHTQKKDTHTHHSFEPTNQRSTITLVVNDIAG